MRSVSPLSTALLSMALTLTLTLGAENARAQDKEKLEAWQKKLLQALEKSGDGRDSGSPPGQGYAPRPGDDPGAARAAAKARAQHGGQVLAVVRVGAGYRVRLLLDSGRVMTAVIRD